MPIPRLAPMEAPYPEEVSDILESMMPPGVEPIGLFRTLAHNPVMLKKLRSASMLSKNALTLRQREILILRTTARCKAEYEWGVHVSFFADRAGFSKEEVTAVSFSSPDASGLGPDEDVLLQLVDSLCDEKMIPDPLYERLQSIFSVEQVMEMIMLVGMYNTVSFLCNGFAIVNEPGTPGFEDYR